MNTVRITTAPIAEDGGVDMEAMLEAEASSIHHCFALAAVQAEKLVNAGATALDITVEVRS